MRDSAMGWSGTGWAGLAAFAVIRLLVADDLAAAEIAVRRGAAAAATPRRLVVSIPDRKLAVVEADAVVRVFEVAVGAPESPSPVGTFTVITRLEHPTYYRPGRVIAPGPANPLGTRWLGLSLAGYGIHGTDQPDSIGHARSHGCIRLRNGDVEKLFPLVRTGDIVELHADRLPEFETWFGTAPRVPAPAKPLSPLLASAAPAAVRGSTASGSPASVTTVAAPEAASR